MKHRALIVLGLAVTAGVLAFVIIQVASVSKDGVKVGLKPAAASCTGNAPDCLPKLPMRDIDGREWTPSDLDGKVVVINFWATWCRPCQAEIPDFAQVYSEYAGKGVVMLGLLAEYGIALEQVRTFAQQFGINYPVVFMEPEVGDAFGNPNQLPTTLIYDRHGNQRYRHMGAITRALLEEEVDLLLGEQ